MIKRPNKRSRFERVDKEFIEELGEVTGENIKSCKEENDDLTIR